MGEGIIDLIRYGNCFRCDKRYAFVFDLFQPALLYLSIYLAVRRDNPSIEMKIGAGTVDIFCAFATRHGIIVLLGNGLNAALVCPLNEQ